MRLTPEELRLLDGLRLNPRRSFRGGVRGERLTKRKGISIEFADHRDYAEGDDLRHLDWNALARLNTPLIKTYQDEEDLAVYLLVDRSPSMAFGEPSKQEIATRLALAFGYVALVGQDAAIPTSLPRTADSPRVLRGRSGYARLSLWAERVETAEAARPLSQSLREFVASGVRPGIVVLLSDGLDPEAPAQLRTLAGRGHEVLMVQILTAAEVDPDLEGDLRLIDSETGNALEITASIDALRAYKANLETHNRALSEACLRGGGRFLRFAPGESLVSFFSGPVRREGWVTT